MKVLIAFDVSDGHEDIKNELKKSGFEDQWDDDNNKVHYLPNTTLINDSLMDLDHANDLFVTAVKDLNSKRGEDNKIKIIRYVSTQIGFLSGPVGDAYS